VIKAAFAHESYSMCGSAVSVSKKEKWNHSLRSDAFAPHCKKPDSKKPVNYLHHTYHIAHVHLLYKSKKVQEKTILLSLWVFKDHFWNKRAFNVYCI